MQPIEFHVEYIPVCVEMRDGSGSLRVALQETDSEQMVRYPYREIGVADGKALARVLAKFGFESLTACVAPLRATERNGEIVHSFVHVVPLVRRNGSILTMPELDGLVWRTPGTLSVTRQASVKNFLWRELYLNCRLACRFLPSEWTAREFRLVYETLDRSVRDASNTRKMVERMVRDGCASRTGRTVATLTRPAPTYVALWPDEWNFYGSPWRKMDY